METGISANGRVDRNVRRIMCAANRYTIPNDGGHVLLCGASHWDKAMHSQANAFDDYLWSAIRASEEQGFIDQGGEFLSREDAFAVARDAGQIIRRCGNDERRLFSENIY